MRYLLIILALLSIGFTNNLNKSRSNEYYNLLLQKDIRDIDFQEQIKSDPFLKEFFQFTPYISIGNLIDGNLEILIMTPVDVGGFQFDVLGASLTGGSGGLAQDAGFAVSTGGETVLGYSFTGSVIPAGSIGVLTNLSGAFSDNVCLSMGPGTMNDFKSGAVSSLDGDIRITTFLVDDCEFVPDISSYGIDTKLIFDCKILNLDGTEADKINFLKGERFNYSFKIQNNTELSISLKSLDVHKNFFDLCHPFSSTFKYNISNLNQDQKVDEDIPFELSSGTLSFKGDLTDFFDYFKNNEKNESSSFIFNRGETIIQPNEELEVLIEFEGVKVGDERYTITPVFFINDENYPLPMSLMPINGRIIIEE